MKYIRISDSWLDKKQFEDFTSDSQIYLIFLTKLIIKLSRKSSAD